ncbi:MAG TPA: amino acid permease, partial [Ktedonobacterales bacterium]|nr:amino acid permease [Ktedonobacterales bacterium]
FTGPFAWLFYVVQVATLLILIFAADTSFAGFPRLLAILARDTFAPAIFSYRGERLAFTTGITVLGVLSAALLLVFQGNVTNLINLYALGVFTAFTLSQTGMALHWYHRQNEAGWSRRLVINGIGALATAVATIVIAIAKFERGAWVTLVIIPILTLGFLATRRYYQRPRIVLLADAARGRHADVALVPIFSHQPLPATPRGFSAAHQVITAMQTRAPAHLTGDSQVGDQTSQGEEHDDAHVVDQEHVNPHRLSWPQVVEQELDYALSVADKVVVLHVVESAHEGEFFRMGWKRYLAAQGVAPSQRARRLQQVEIEILVSPYRTIVAPLVNFIRWRCRDIYTEQRVVVLLPRQLHRKWWEWPLQRRVARRVRRQLQADGAITVIDVPYELGHAGAGDLTQAADSESAGDPSEGE